MENIITVKGTAYEQGVIQGKALAQVILNNVNKVKAKVITDKVGAARYEAFVEKNAGFMQKNHPDLIEEMRGIADGSGISFKDVLMLNIPAYFMTKYFNQECSMIMARGKATIDGCTYLIKNRDMSTYIEQAVIKREKADGSSVIEVNGAGTVTYPASGMSSYGLGVATTGFWSKYAEPDLDEVDAAHIFVNIRLLLENCKTAKEVIEYLKTSPRMNGLNIIAVDEKDAFVIETTRNAMYIEEDDGSGILYRTNHYILPETKHLNPDPNEYKSTYKRSERIGQMLNDCNGKIRFQDLLRIMSDHENGINSICRHPKGDVLANTVSTSMVVLEDREAWTSIGNPCVSMRCASLKEKDVVNCE
jgi:predicted choloylglycine hydrolase